jgi:hypothetical protein
MAFAATPSGNRRAAFSLLGIVMSNEGLGGEGVASFEVEDLR